MRQFWVPWEEYIPYNETNLPELIIRYIENPKLSAQIASNAQSKIIGMPASWGEMAWDRICAAYDSEVNIHGRIEYNLSLEPSIIYHRTATPLLYNYDYGKDFPHNWRELFFERIDNAISSARRTEEKIPPLVEASRLAFLLDRSALSLAYLEQLELYLPEYGWIYYFKARIAFADKKYDEALGFLERAIVCGTKTPELLGKYVLPIIEKGNSCDGRRVTDYMWEAVHGSNGGYQVKSMMHLSYELEGYIHTQKKERARAVKSYLSAVENLAIPDCIHRLAPMLIETGDYLKLADITSAGLKDSPYDTIVLLYEVYGLLWTGRNKDAAGKLLQHRRALHGFKGIRQLNLIRLILLGIIPFILLSRRLSSLLIEKLIQIIKRKSGENYLDSSLSQG